MNKGTAIVGFFLCFLAGMGLMWGLDHRGEDAAIKGESGPVDHTTAKIPVDPATDPIWGNLDAPVTIVEISDFECPFCDRVNPTLKQIKSEYGPEKVRIVWKHNPLPFHKNATPAHEAAVAVFKAAGGGEKGSEAFFKFHDQAFQNQKQLTAGNFEKWAGQAGVDVGKFKELLKDKDTKAKVQKDLAMASSIGARGTPNFRVNGVEVSGAQPFNKFKEIIDKELAEAKRLMNSGVPAGQIYLRRLEKNAGGGDAPAQADQKAEPQQPPEDTTIWKVPVHDDDPQKGPDDALVTIVEWSDFQCPFCSRVEPTMDKIVETYGKDVRVVWKDNALPFHPRAKPAAALARAAYDKGGDQGFWKAHKLIFANQKQIEDEHLEKYAGELGLNWTMVKKAIDDDKYGDRIQQSMDEAMELKARGTPHFFVNGFRVSGAQPFEKFKEVVDKQLAEAKKLVASGTPRAKVYEKIMETAKGPPPPETKEVADCKDCPYKGAANAPVVIHQFSDFQCPFCSRVEPTMTQLEEEYGSKVKIVWRNLPLEFHKQAPLAAEASLEAFAQKGNAGFWKYHAGLFEKQREPGALERAGLEKLAAEQGLDMTKFKAALDSHKHQAAVEADKKAAQAAGITGTPGFVVGKYWISGAQPYGQFRKLVELSLKEK